jgi:hypothetical protein
MRPKQIVTAGILSGLVGGTVLAAWFLIIDTIEGQPFYTPAFLSSILARADATDRSIALMSMYTVIHYAAYCGVGVGCAWLLSKFRSCPWILFGLVVGFVLFDLVFYLGVVITGVDIVDELGWRQVLSGNLLAGVALMGFLRVRLKLPTPSLLSALTRHRIVREGVVVGLLGAIAVAVWFLVFDVVRGQILFTPGALGSALFLGVSDISEVQLNLLTVGGYTLVHFAAFIVVGLVAETIAVHAERPPPLILAGWVVIGLGNLVAAAVMASYLLWSHPKLRAALGEQTLSAEDLQVSADDR